MHERPSADVRPGVGQLIRAGITRLLLPESDMKLSQLGRCCSEQQP